MNDFRDRLLSFLGERAPAPPPGLYAGEDAPPASSRPGAGEDLAARFRSELEAVGGEVCDLGGEQEPETVVAGLLQPFRGSRVAIDGDPGWDRVGFSMETACRSAGVEVERVDDATPAAGLADTALGMTIADFAIAESGTIVQGIRPFRPRSLSLLPPAHLVVLPRNRLLAGFEDFFEIAGKAGMTATEGEGGGGYFTWVTGPSRTADIEKVLTIGVHGPGRLLAVLLPEEVSI